jgi:hypothetical protein
MILRPVSPQSPTGPPMTKEPVGLMWNLVPLWIQSGGHDGQDDVLHHRLAQVLVVHVGVVLGGQHHRLHPDHLIVGVAQGDLALGIRAQPGQDVGLAHLGLALDQAMGIGDGRGHEDISLVGGVTEHQALVAGTLLLGGGTVHALGDVAGLFADQGHDGTGRAVEADMGTGVADVADHLAYHLVEVDPGVGGDFTADDHGPGLDHGLAGDAGVLGVGVLGQNGIQDRVGDLISDLVRMTLGDGFGGEDGFFRHGGVRAPCCGSPEGAG